MRQQNLQPFNMARLMELRRVRGNSDSFQPFWDELKIILKRKHNKNSEWERMENDDIVLGEVWNQSIGQIYYRNEVHKFSYLYTPSQRLVIGMHGHNEPTNGGKQIMKFKEWYFFPDGTFRFCDKDEKHMLFNTYGYPIYILSVKIGAMA